MLVLVVLAAASARDAAPARAASDGMWLGAAGMTVARERPTATLLPGGRVLVEGGVNAVAGTPWSPRRSTTPPATPGSPQAPWRLPASVTPRRC